jgi:translation elongation factor EF-1beta
MCFGLFQLQMGAVVTDEVSVDDLQEQIEGWEDEVQSTEILAFQKI